MRAASIRKALGSEAGATAIEYSVLVGLISLTCLIVWQTIGTSLSTMFYGHVTEVFVRASGGV